MLGIRSEPSHSLSADIEDLDNWHGKPIPKDRVDELLNDLQAQIQVPNKTLCPELPINDLAPADLTPILLPSPPAYKKGDKVHVEDAQGMYSNIWQRGEHGRKMLTVLRCCILNRLHQSRTSDDGKESWERL